MPRLTAAASGAAAALAVHAAVNARLLRTPPPAATVTERVSVLLPVRNEAAHVEACLEAVRASTHLDDVEVLVLDDGSTDGTAELVRGARLIRGDGVLPAGWLGKPYACARLADAATGTVLVFLDADVVLAPDGLARTVGLLRGAGLDLVSPYPRQRAETPAERLLQPLLQWSWLTFLPLRAAERSPRPSLAAANGQLLAVDAAAYRKAGGHAAVRDQVVEDVALLRAFKRAGARGVVADGTEIATTRMYAGWAELRDGYAKSLWSAGPGPAVLLAALYVWPAVRGGRAGAVGYAAGVAGRVVAARRTGGRAWPDALAHPVSVAAFCWLTGLSVLRHRRGTLSWKGRPLP